MTSHVLQTPRGILVISKSKEFPRLGDLEPFISWDSRRSDYPDYLGPTSPAGGRIDGEGES